MTSLIERLYLQHLPSSARSSQSLLFSIRYLGCCSAADILWLMAFGSTSVCTGHNF